MPTYRHRLLEVVTPPAAEPVTLAEAKLFLRVDGSAEDALITDLITVARMAAEEYLGKSLITQVWRIAFDDYLEDGTPLPRGPVLGITGITSFDEDESMTVVAESLYRLNAARDMVLLDSDILDARIEINYLAGYGDASSVPKPIKQGMLTHIATLYDNREQPQLPLSCMGLYDSYREIRL